MRKLHCLFLAVLLVITSCTKGVFYEQDTIKPKIEIVYPLDEPVVRAGDPLCMKVLINDDKSLMNVWLQVIGGNGFKKDYTVSGRSMDITEKYIVPSGVNGNMVAKFFAMDETGNASSAEINFVVNN
jgi:hypothetical protein